MRTVRLPDGAELPALGQGTWRMGEMARGRDAEIRALRLGIDLGMTVIDTAEMYGDGGSERVVGEAIAGRRDAVFLVSKVLPSNASRDGVRKACARSLRRLRTDRLDLYLLHWPGSEPLAETIAGFEALREAGHILRWGVSNFDADEMPALAAAGCATNQVLYNPEHRGIEHDLLPWARDRAMPLMAYSPVGQGGALLRHRAIRDVAARHGVTAAQVAIAWSMRGGGVLSIPKAATETHIHDNAAAASLVLEAEDRAAIDAAFPPPARKVPLAVL